LEFGSPRSLPVTNIVVKGIVTIALIVMIRIKHALIPTDVAEDYVTNQRAASLIMQGEASSSSTKKKKKTSPQGKRKIKLRRVF
jgi:hypothetical protein